MLINEKYEQKHFVKLLVTANIKMITVDVIYNCIFNCLSDFRSKKYTFSLFSIPH